MNLILLYTSDFTDDNTVVINDRRFHHIRSVHQPESGETLKVGLLDGNRGIGEVLSLCDKEVVLNVTLDKPAPESLPVKLVLALPRPKMMKRTLQTIAAMGVKEIYLINSYRVDKSYWSSPLLQPEKIREQLVLGLEQAGDTVMPEVHLRKRFKPFVEDELPEMLQNKSGLLAHPGGDKVLSDIRRSNNSACLLAIGPEGGFIEYEVQSLVAAGLIQFSLGPRILRCDTVIPYLAAAL